MTPRYDPTWKRAKYTIMTDKGAVTVDGIANSENSLGVHFNGGCTCDVTHIASGLRLKSFHQLGHAIAFVDRVTPLTDWSKLHPIVPADEHIARICEEVTA